MKVRDEKMTWLETTTCKECYKAKRSMEPPEVFLREVTGGMEIIVLNSFAVKDTLKERDYRFSEFSVDVPRNLLDVKAPRPGWSMVAHLPKLLETEMQWISALGWPVKNLSGAPYQFAALSAVIEGRPDVGGLPHDLSGYDRATGTRLGFK